MGSKKTTGKKSVGILKAEIEPATDGSSEKLTGGFVSISANAVSGDTVVNGDPCQGTNICQVNERVGACGSNSVAGCASSQ